MTYSGFNTDRGICNVRGRVTNRNQQVGYFTTFGEQDGDWNLIRNSSVITCHHYHTIRNNNNNEQIITYNQT